MREYRIRGNWEILRISKSRKNREPRKAKQKKVENNKTYESSKEIGGNLNCGRTIGSINGRK